MSFGIKTPTLLFHWRNHFQLQLDDSTEHGWTNVRQTIGNFRFRRILRWDDSISKCVRKVHYLNGIDRFFIPPKLKKIFNEPCFSVIDFDALWLAHRFTCKCMSSGLVYTIIARKNRLDVSDGL